MKKRNRLPALVLFAICATGAGSLLNVPNAFGLVRRAINLISGTGATASCVDNFTSGQQDCTISASGTGATCPIDLTSCVANILSVGHGGTGSNTFTSHGVLVGEGTSLFQSVGGACTGGQALTCNTGADPSFAAVASSVTGTSPISCSPTTGAVSCSLGVVPATLGGTGTASPTAHYVALAEGSSPFNFVPPATAGIALVSNGVAADPSFSTVLTAGGGTGLNSPGASGNLLISNGSIWTTTPSAGQLVGRAIVTNDIGIAGGGGITTEWAHLTVATTTANTATQFAADNVTWTSQVFGTLSVTATPTAGGAPVFEISGVSTGDRINIRLETADIAAGHQDEGMVLAYAVSSSAPTWPGGYTVTTATVILGSTGLFANTGSVMRPVIASAYMASAPSGGNVWVQPAVVNLFTTASSQFTELGAGTNLIVEDWR